MSHSSSTKAIVIGSGVAGLVIAVRLAIQGTTVTVYEKKRAAGGKISSFKKENYQFDAGPSLFTQPENIRELFELAGEPIEPYFQFDKCNIACKYFYPNGKEVNAFTDAGLFAAELNDKLGEDPMVIKKYLSDSEKLYERTGSIFLNRSLHKIKTWFDRKVFAAFAATKMSYLFSTLNRYNGRKFSSPEATQLFNRYATYNGSSPFKAPAMLSLIPHVEHNEGIFYPRGGMISIAEALYKLALKKGVVFHFDAHVERIIQHEGRARGIVINGENIFADVVVSNVDAYFTYRNLLNNHARAAKILRQERSSSAMIFYWGINRKFSQLELHNIFFSGDYKKEFDFIFNKKQVYSDPTVYVNITSKFDPTHAPANCDNWFVMINVPANNGQDWATIKEKARKAAIFKISAVLGEDIEQYIAVEETLDPIGIENDTASYMGSLYGTSSNSRMAAFVRHPNFTNKVRNLYFCGGSVHPGGGIPLCFKSAKITSELISNDIKKKRH